MKILIGWLVRHEDESRMTLSGLLREVRDVFGGLSLADKTGLK